MRSRAGFTLVELMVTLTILSIGVLAVAALMPAGTRSLTRARSLTSGTLAASQKLEDLKALSWSDPALTPGSHTDHVGFYARAWTIEDDVPLRDVKKVTVTATWTSTTGSRSTTVVSYLPHLGT